MHSSIVHAYPEMNLASTVHFKMEIASYCPSVHASAQKWSRHRGRLQLVPLSGLPYQHKTHFFV
uniref:Uncharacterized protein n=1 Tax=Anguilla anguilla TaxID=7936 RepID=A0A0E9Y279_ANGAN